MADITDVEPLSSWSLREIVMASKLNSQLVSKITLIKDNQVTINTASELLLQGVAGGIHQAKIPFAMAAAPTGWERDTGFLTDHILRVTDGSTLPPGANPTIVGGAHGGDWSITGLSSLIDPDHTHTLYLHTHSMAHTHTFPTHTHSMQSHTHQTVGHTHTIYPSTIAFTGVTGTTTFSTWGGSESKMSTGYHGHYTNHGHPYGGENVPGATGSGGDGLTSGVSSPTETSPSGTTVNSMSGSGYVGNYTGATGIGGGHSHTINHDGTWRPKYLNMLMCKKS